MKPTSTTRIKGQPSPSRRSARDRQKPFVQQRDVPDSPQNIWRWACALVLIAAGLLRLLYLTEKPLHHDEGVNGLFLSQLFHNGFYHYNPANYHGPTLYFFGLVTTTLNSLFYGKYGLSTFAIRLVPALFGTGIVWLIFYFRRSIGKFGSMTAAMLVTVSPGFVFFSRYFIHEILFVFFTLALVVTIMRFRETAQPRYLMWAAACAALLFATKETFVITAVVLVLAYLCMRVYMHLRNRLAGDSRSGLSKEKNKEAEDLTENSGILTPQLIATAAPVFVVVSMLFYSSFFTNPQGVLDSIRTFGYWGKTGTTEYLSPWPTYLKWLSQIELPALALGGLGIVVALIQVRSRFAVFSAFWALGITAAYSLVPYKTPWLALNLVLPLAIMAGYFLGQWYELGNKERSPLLRASAVMVLLAALASSSYQAIDLSFFSYDNDAIPYSYAHTVRDFLGLVDEIERVASHNPAGKNIGISVMSPEHWPLPWYLRDYPNVGYWGKIIPTSEPIIIASEQQASEVEKKLSILYRRFHSYGLRPGARLVLFLRGDQRP